MKDSFPPLLLTLFCQDDDTQALMLLVMVPNRYWLCSATTSSIKIWDLERKSVVDELKVDLKAEAEKCDSGVGTGNQKKLRRYVATERNVAIERNGCSVATLVHSLDMTDSRLHPSFQITDVYVTANETLNDTLYSKSELKP
ncbi:hypothetical protein F2Q69_00022446 [Brassica cretica]|uniref:Uncharacterized protein n=1 Tax=Brassica cretica TaxID=69181 RepID=A0A8S9QIY0_BRACR|nr:hypothetical protein F2Q69_00022446 [Brassica cretica]